MDQAVTELNAAAARWSLSNIVQIADTPSSRVYRVERGDAGRAVLKILKDYGEDEILGVTFMRWCRGQGAAEIFDVEGRAILMEWLGGITLGDVVRAGGDKEATASLCSVISELQQLRDGPPNGLMPLREKFRALYESTVEMWPVSHRDIAGRAIELASKLFATAPAPVPLHGDCHHDNIVGSHRGWLAIDPKGLVGDPAYETANCFRNPYGASDVARRPERIDHLADRFASTLGLDRTRVLSWAAAHSALSACWDRAAGNSLDWDLTMLPRLMAALDRS